jgi:predicted flap endonuclease-1-like 5' DNA nuclease
MSSRRFPALVNSSDNASIELRTMATPLARIAGIGPNVRLKFKAAGVKTTAKLLEQARTAKGRQELAEKTDMNPKTILEMANLIDRMRVKGVGQDYSRLLAAAGVVTVAQLQFRSPAKLAKAMADANAKRKLVRVLPSVPTVGRWIEHAKKLPLKISY